MNDVVTRPNGKSYRARKPPAVVEFEDYDGMTRVAVLRTHDVEAAKVLAAERLTEYELDAESPSQDWWKLVPWDTGSGYDRNWVTDETVGIPVVVFGE